MYPLDEDDRGGVKFAFAKGKEGFHGFMHTLLKVANSLDNTLRSAKLKTLAEDGLRPGKGTFYNFLFACRFTDWAVFKEILPIAKCRLAKKEGSYG